MLTSEDNNIALIDNNIALIDLQKMQINTVKKILNKKKTTNKSWYKHLCNNSFKIIVLIGVYIKLHCTCRNNSNYQNFISISHRSPVCICLK